MGPPHVSRFVATAAVGVEQEQTQKITSPERDPSLSRAERFGKGKGKERD